MERDKLLLQSTKHVSKQSTSYPFHLKAALGKQSGPATFKLRKGIKSPAIFTWPGIVGAMELLFDVTRRVDYVVHKSYRLA
jgi:hypothetical protein